MTSAGDPRRGGPIDWTKLRERLARAVAATEEALQPSPERARQIMDARARALAQRPAQETDSGEKLQLVTFTLGAERYAIETRYLREVIHLVDVTPVPGAPDFVIGLANLRGEVLALFDLVRFFDIAKEQRPKGSQAIVLGIESAEFGVPVDAVHGTVELPVKGLIEPTGAAAGPQRDCQRGVTEDALIVIDGAALLADRRLFIGSET